mmetsp:Transcript_10656/g.22479  ORF Transcript_10656/g.22479 Transcript_10656/m.22479 type:complete len:200 (+) Transcript_10656:2183-2782(+)
MEFRQGRVPEGHRRRAGPLQQGPNSTTQGQTKADVYGIVGPSPVLTKILWDGSDPAPGGDLVLVAQLKGVVAIIDLRAENFQVGFPIDLSHQTLVGIGDVLAFFVACFRHLSAVFHPPQEGFTVSEISGLDRPGLGKEAPKDLPVHGFHRQQGAGTGPDLLQKGNNRSPIPDQRIFQPEGFPLFALRQKGLQAVHVDRR